MRRRFLIPADMITSSTVTVDGDLFRHIARVLRLQPGDELILCNGEGVDFNATLLEIGSRSLKLEITGSRAEEKCSSPKPSFTLLQALPKSDKFDFIIQKATELGINSIVAFPAAHSVVKIASDQVEARIARWRKIAAEASRQSERNSVPEISLAKNMLAALHEATEPVKLFLWEREKANRLRESLARFDSPTSAAFLVGPEGGFSVEEGVMAIKAGFQAVSMGPRILRTETAGVAMLSILQYQWGDMG